MIRIACLVILTLTCACSISANFGVQVGQQRAVPPDTVKQAVIIGTKSDSIVEWEERVRGVKENLWLDACKNSVGGHRRAQVVGWSGDFVEIVHLEFLRWWHGENDTERLFFTWDRDSVRNIWIRREEK